VSELARFRGEASRLEVELMAANRCVLCAVCCVLCALYAGVMVLCEDFCSARFFISKSTIVLLYGPLHLYAYVHTFSRRTELLTARVSEVSNTVEQCEARIQELERREAELGASESTARKAKLEMELKYEGRCCVCVCVVEWCCVKCFDVLYSALFLD